MDLGNGHNVVNQLVSASGFLYEPSLGPLDIVDNSEAELRHQLMVVVDASHAHFLLYQEPLQPVNPDVAILLPVDLLHVAVKQLLIHSAQLVVHLFDHV